jgi:hypothetical protein
LTEGLLNVKLNTTSVPSVAEAGVIVATGIVIVDNGSQAVPDKSFQLLHQ